MGEYYLGLDMGSGSVGWAVTNEKYEVLRAHGKSLWGVRFFETANTAEERRMFRTNRRRLQRRNWRIDLLQELFAEEIVRVDDGFFLRMKESKYLPEDKRDKEGNCPQLPYALFVDESYTDKEYHKQFPTIYHLRKWLMETQETPDIRLVYLAFHHLMKHRGHFLFSGSMESIREFQPTFQTMLDMYKEELDFNCELQEQNIEKIEDILRNRELTKSAKKTNLIKQMGAKNVCEKAVCGLLAGSTVKLSEIFGDKTLDESEKTKIAFSDNGYEDYCAELEALLGEQYVIIEAAKAVYDCAVLADILGEYGSISEAKVAIYEKHKKDLLYLKKLVKKELSPSIYKEIFVLTQEKTANYSAYIGSTKYNGKKKALEGKQCSKDEFYDFLKKKVLNPISDGKKTTYLKQELEKGTFLPKQVIKDNGVLPHQIHLFELNQILDNLKTRIPLLGEQEEKIRQIFTFRIPYYVGPLNGIRKNGQTTNWMVRKSSDKIYPWNFEDVVDVESSAEKFIRRMTNKCTYLTQEDVLPKNSLLYSKFTVLNELNNLRLDGQPISVENKQLIYTGLFQRTRKVNQKKLRDFLVREGIAKRNVEITGIDGDFKGTLTAYHDFKQKLTNCDLSDDAKENIILNITLFGEDKKLLAKRLKTLYPNLTEGNIRALCNLSYQGWGRLSQKFLSGITAPAPETGEVWTVVQAMWESNDNLMQVLSSKYQFVQAIDEENNRDVITDITYDIVDKLYVSPAVKRQIWQTLQIVKELCKVMGNPPKRVFVEMAREKQESKRTDSRKKQLIDLYNKCKKEEPEWMPELENTSEQQFRSDKLFLYYTQKGRCMYSGEPISLEDLWDNRKYDIDHIYPQSKVMDDSLDNRVLVKKQYNAEKTDNYPIKAEIRNKMRSYWKMLLDGNFISKEKYNRLTRTTEFEDNELTGFIARQLVETRQGTKAVASILNQFLPDSEIVYVKAKNVSQFRQDFDLIKVREINDLHHAKDAYLNIVVGNAYYTKFTKDASWYIKKYPGRSYNLKKMFTSEYDISRNGEVAWKAGAGGTIGTVKKFMKKNNILVTRRSYQVKGGLFDQQLMKKGKGQVPVKGSDLRLGSKESIEKYGGYNKATGSYFMLVESEDKKGNLIRTIEYVPLYLKNSIEIDEKKAIEYLTGERELKKPKILIGKIKIDTLFKVDSFYMWLSGRTGNRLIFKGANQLLLTDTETQILKKVLKFVERKKVNKELQIIDRDGISEMQLLEMYDLFLNKIRNTIYGVRLGAQEKTLVEKKSLFIGLSNEDKCIVLAEILHMFQCQSGSANLKLINGPRNAGILVMSNIVTNCKQIFIMNQSPTGIFEQEIDLLGKL